MAHAHRTRLCLALLLAAALSAAADLDAMNYGAKADGITDDTAAIQKALHEAGTKGEAVNLPPGQYRLDGTLEIPPGATLRGSWPGPHAGILEVGTVLMAYGGRGDESATPLLSLHTSSTLQGITVFYPEQRVEEIVPYPWTIQGRGQHYNVMDVTLINAFNGVDCGTYHNEGHHLRNVHMCCLSKGLFIDQCTDVGRVENVHIHSVYWWRLPAPYALPADGVDRINAYTMEHLEGFVIGKTDWEFMSNCFVIWPKVGWRFTDTGKGPGNAVITQSGSDIGPLAVQIDAVQDHAGVAFENCQFMSGFNIGPSNKGPVKLTNCGFWGPAGSGSQMILEGSGTVMLTATHFAEWDQPRKGEPFVKALAGSLLVNACDFFEREEGPNIYLGEGIRSAAIVGNRFRGSEARIEYESGQAENVQILANVTD